MQFTTNRMRQNPALQLLSSMPYDRCQSEDAKVDRTCRVHRTGIRKFTHHQCCFADPEAAATVFFRDSNSEKACVRHSFIEIVRKFVTAILCSPVLIRKALA